MAKSYLGMFGTAAEDEPLANEKAVTRWVANLRANDPIGGALAISQLLETASGKQQVVTSEGVIALLTLDRLSLPMQTQVQAQYWSAAMSESVRQQLWNAHKDLARGLAYSYEQLVEYIRSRPEDRRLNEHLLAVLSRMFYYRRVQAKQGLFRYEQWIPAQWRHLHAAYKEASRLGIATTPFSLADHAKAGERSSIEQEYLQFLLLQRNNTGNLSVAQVEQASQWLRTWVPALHLVAAPPESASFWLLDLGKAEGLVAPRPDQPAGELLYLDVTPLLRQLTELIARLNEQLAAGGDRSATRELKERLALAKRLERQWTPNSPPLPRRGARRTDQRAILVAPGWAEIGLMMREARPWRPHDPYKYSYDDATELVALGRAQGPKKDRQVDKDNLHPDRRGWEVLDMSESGCRIQSTTRRAAQLQIGNLLGLLLEGDTRWRIGVVRRLKRRTAEHTELGLEVIAESSLLVMPESVGTGESGYSVNGVDINAKGRAFDALYLVPQTQTQTPPVRSLVVPAAEFAPGRILSLRVEGENAQIRLSVPIEYAWDWVWTTFEVIGPAK